MKDLAFEAIHRNVLRKWISVRILQLRSGGLKNLKNVQEFQECKHKGIEVLNE